MPEKTLRQGMIPRYGDAILLVPQLQERVPAKMLLKRMVRALMWRKQCRPCLITIVVPRSAADLHPEALGGSP